MVPCCAEGERLRIAADDAYLDYIAGFAAADAKAATACAVPAVVAANAADRAHRATHGGA